MSQQPSAVRSALIALLTTLMSVLGVGSSALAQPPADAPLHFQVDEPTQRLEMIVNTSRILTLEHKVPDLLVNNPDVVRATPLSPNQIQVSALKPGVTQMNIWDERNQVYAVEVVVYGDSRELANLLRSAFPQAQLELRPLASSIVLSGYVPSADMVTRIVEMAQDYYPKVINNITIGNAQQVMLHVKVIEVSRTKLRRMGIDWLTVNFSNPTQFFVNRQSGMISDYLTGDDLLVRNGNDALAAGIVDGDQGFFALLESLRQNNLAKVMAEPTLVTMSGRPASFNSGGEIPIPVPSGLGTVAIEYREFGTRVDFVPIVLGNGYIRLEVRPQVSDIDPARSTTANNFTVPGFRTRWADTAVEMKAGQTLALAGLIQNRLEAENRGIPWLCEMPWIGSFFRRVEETNNEVELLILVTPEFVEAMDAHEVPPCGPGQMTTTPNNKELFWRGYIEVPQCCTDGSCTQCQSVSPALYAPMGEPLPAQSGGTYEYEALPAAPVAPQPPVGPSAGGSANPSIRPVATTPSNRRSRTLPSAPAQETVTDRPPQLIGPIGYDELK